jgi:hypothetical protein
MADAVADDGAPIAASKLQEHTSEESCWLAIHGNVYDVSKYLLEHPGGMDVMMEHAGTAPRVPLARCQASLVPRHEPRAAGGLPSPLSPRAVLLVQFTC